ncbi:MAG: hypothetical protein IT373_07005 [Polyangiaceae bacterium]|nr:hypothetical protein [Polyangiaceae bacterium]
MPEETLATVEEWLGADEEHAEHRLDDTFGRFESAQPALAARIGAALGRANDEVAVALGYFLSLLVWLAFDRAFGARVAEVSELAVRGVEESLALDEELRRGDPAEAVDSDEVVAMEQPHVLELVHQHLDAALDAHAERADVDAVHRVYRLILVEILALSYATAPPAGPVEPSAEGDA